jgi:hypothetical protein
VKRRDFLLRSALTLPGLVLANPPLRAIAGIDAGRDGRPVPFSSIHCATDRPEAAIRALQKAIARTGSGRPCLGLREFTLPGRHLGDIALIGPHGVVNFWESGGELARALREVAIGLDLPRTLADPTLLAFETGISGSGPRTTRITRDRELLTEIDLDGPARTLTIPGPSGGRRDGARGETVVSIGEGNARILSATCRHRTCVEMGAIAGAGESLVCVPARLIVSIGGRQHPGIDSVVG